MARPATGATEATGAAGAAEATGATEELDSVFALVFLLDFFSVAGGATSTGAATGAATCSDSVVLDGLGLGILLYYTLLNSF